MKPDAIKERLAACPFRPFAVELADGTRHRVFAPDRASLSPNGRVLVLWVGYEEAVHIAVPRIASICDARRRSA